MIYRPAPIKGGGRLVAISPGEQRPGEQELRCALDLILSVGGRSRWRYRSKGSVQRTDGAVLPQRRRGRKFVRAAVAVLLRVVVLRSEAVN